MRICAYIYVYIYIYTNYNKNIIIIIIYEIKICYIFKSNNEILKVKKELINAFKN